MALLPPVLIAELLKVYSSFPPSPAQAAQGLANAYDLYAQAAMAGSALPMIPPTSKLQLQAQLLAALTNPLTGSPPILAQAWATGLQLYWMAPPIPFSTGGGPPAGVVTVFAGQLALVSCLTGIYANLTNTPVQAANGSGQCLDVATRTVIVGLITPPSPSPVPTPLS